MHMQEAIQGIGKPFKVLLPGVKADIIRNVDMDGTVHGDFLEAHCWDCRLIGEQPEHLKKKVVCPCGDPECGNPIILCT
jgi:hypothetical protein